MHGVDELLNHVSRVEKNYFIADLVNSWKWPLGMFMGDSLGYTTFL